MYISNSINHYFLQQKQIYKCCLLQQKKIQKNFVDKTRLNKTHTHITCVFKRDSYMIYIQLIIVNYVVYLYSAYNLIYII